MKVDKTFCYDKSIWLSPNKFHADEILKLFSGEKGEIFQFLQTNFYSNLFLPYGDQIGKIFDKIASEDLFHSKQLAECVVMLGGTPTYSQNNIFLTTKNISYSTNLKDILSFEIENKEQIIINYKISLEKINNKYLQNFLNSILKDEKNHLKILNEIKEITFTQTIEENQNLC